MSTHRLCCCTPGASWIDCDTWCDCLPAQATVHNLLIEETSEIWCGPIKQLEIYRRVQLQGVTLILNPLCFMASNDTGTWNYIYRERTYTTPRTVYKGGNIQGNCAWPGCVSACDQYDLCRTFERTGNGTGPSIQIFCDNACQQTVTDAHSRMDWLLNGTGTEKVINHNPYPAYDAFQVCRYGVHDACNPGDDYSTSVNISDNGVIWGHRGCLQTSTFATFNACQSILCNNTQYPYNLCDSPAHWPLCYACKSETMENDYGGYQAHEDSTEWCPATCCAGCHACLQWDGAQYVHTSCCGDGSAGCGIICPDGNDGCVRKSRETCQWKVTLVFSVP